MAVGCISIGCAALLVACASEGVVGSLARNADGGPGAEGGSDGGGGPALPLTIADAPVGAGGGSTCVRTSSEEIRCWGDNTTGALGIGDVEPASSAEPVAPRGLDAVVAIASGEVAHCALRRDGQVLCWGEMPAHFNEQSFDHLPIANPFAITGLGAVARVAVGRYFTCALETNGELRCFGLNDVGQLGIGSTERKDLPTTVGGLDAPVTSVAASMGGLFACATTQLGSVYCWGRVDRGQAGQGPPSARSPRRVDGLPAGALEVVAGGAHACARFAGGELRCWGANEAGQLGDGTTTSRPVPVTPAFLSDVVGLAAGRAHTCAVRSEGSVWCWGDDADGQAGRVPDPTRPSIVVQADFGATAVACGLQHTCAWASGGHVLCWGSNGFAQLGPKEGTF